MEQNEELAKNQNNISEEMLKEFEQQVIPQQIDGIKDAEQLEPEENLELVESYENEFEEFNKKYKIDKKMAYIDEEKGEVVDRSNLTPWEMIQSLSREMGANLKDPKKGCRSCHGRGYIGIHADTHTPIPCLCLFDEEAKKKQKEMMAQLGFMNRRTKRHLHSVMTKERQLWVKKQAIKDNKERQLSIKTKKKKIDKTARLSRRINRQKRK